MTSEPAVTTSIEERLEALLEKTPGGESERALVRRAYEVSSRFHSHQTRKSGGPYIEHPIAVAHLMADMKMDASSIAAALLHDIIEDTELTHDDLKELFPDPIPDLVQGVTKISRIHFNATREAQIENLRKIILAMAQDIRVIILKLCDRLHNMRTLEHLSEQRQRAIAQETLDIYAPLANRLGIITMKTEMEDLAMRYLHPSEYKELAQAVSSKRGERHRRIERTMEFLRNYLEELGHTDLLIDGRSKHFYSIYRKMRQQGLTFDEIYDLNAVRIICHSEAQCYEIMGQIHSIWRPLPGRIKDYIGMPKPNMYQSLHTTVVGLNGMITEIQIRSEEMHRIAEYGIAAHWKYKEGRLDKTVDRKLAWLRQLAEWATEAGEPDTLLDGLKGDVFADEALCFTPRGDVVELPAGATPIDFAFAIHTQVGERCVGARVNRRIVSLRTKLKHGDVVEILTSKSGHPSRDWLDVVKTGRARNKIKHWLKSKEMERWVADGRDSLNRVLKERNFDVPKSELDSALENLLEPFQMQRIEDVLAEIGFGTISAQAAISRMNPDWSRPRRKTPERSRRRRKPDDEPIIVGGLEGVPIRIANCCSPIPGDPIVAFVTRGRGVTVHRDDCPSIARMRKSESASQRLQPANWNGASQISRAVMLRVEASDRSGLLSDISAMVAECGANIIACLTRTDRDRGLAVLKFELDVSSVSQLEQVMAEMRQISGVYRVERTARGI